MRVMTLGAIQRECSLCPPDEIGVAMGRDDGGRCGAVAVVARKTKRVVIRGGGQQAGVIARVRPVTSGAGTGGGDVIAMGTAIRLRRNRILKRNKHYCPQQNYQQEPSVYMPG